VISTDSGSDSEDSQPKRRESSPYHPLARLMDLCPARKRASLANPDALDEDGLLKDVDVQVPTQEATAREDKRRDVDEFFLPRFIQDMQGKQKKYRTCKVCP